MAAPPAPVADHVAECGHTAAWLVGLPRRPLQGGVAVAAGFARTDSTMGLALCCRPKRGTCWSFWLATAMVTIMAAEGAAVRELRQAPERALAVHRRWRSVIVKAAWRRFESRVQYASVRVRVLGWRGAERCCNSLRFDTCRGHHHDVVHALWARILQGVFARSLKEACGLSVVQQAHHGPDDPPVVPVGQPDEASSHTGVLVVGNACIPSYCFVQCFIILDSCIFSSRTRAAMANLRACA